MVWLQCNKCGTLKDIELPVELPMDDCVALYVKHIKELHPLEKLGTMVSDKYYDKAAELYNGK
jgi:hypothetical protein